MVLDADLGQFSIFPINGDGRGEADPRSVPMGNVTLEGNSPSPLSSGAELWSSWVAVRFNGAESRIRFSTIELITLLTKSNI